MNYTSNWEAVLAICNKAFYPATEKIVAITAIAETVLTDINQNKQESKD